MEFYQIILLFLAACSLLALFIILVLAISFSNKKEVQEDGCSKCGSSYIYIASPDHCYDCFEKYEWKKIDNMKPPNQVVLAAWYLSLIHI